MTAFQTAREMLIREIAPPEDIGPVAWAERHIKLLDGDRVGNIRFDRGYEFQRDILETFFAPYAPGERRRIGVCFKGAQSGITTLCLIGLLYLVAHRKLSSFHLMPREFDALDKAKKIAEFIGADPTLTAAFPPGLLRVRKTGGGQTLRVAYSNSMTELKNWSAGAGVFDEVDELEMRLYNSIAAAKMRMGGYRRAIEIYIGTPTIPEYGIDLIWKESDQRLYWILCPLCDGEQTLTWEGNIRWDASPGTIEQQAATAEFVCAECSEPWDERLREMANARGEWRATFPDRPIIGFGLNRLLVPSSIPSKMVSDYLTGLQSDQAMREHENQNLGRAYLPMTGQLTDTTIGARIDSSLTWGKVPSDAVMMTVGADVQGDAPPYEFLWEVRAFRPDGFVYLIAYGIAKTIAEMAELFGAKGLLERARYRVSAGFADATNGVHKDTVEELCREVPIFQAARFEWRMRGFKRATIEKIKGGRKGQKGHNLNLDDALQDNIGRFFELPNRPPRIAIAPCPSRALEANFIEQYTKIARVKGDGPGDEAEWRFKKLRQKNVDFPFAGALAEAARRQRGGTVPGAGVYGAIKEIKKHASKHPGAPAAASEQGGASSARRVVRIARGKPGGHRRY